MKERLILFVRSSLILVLALLFVLAACEPARPLRVGFVANLNGPSGELGVQARDATLLAFEQQNAKGGVDGRPLELLVKHCPRNPDATLAVSREVLDAGVVAVLGFTTSDMATAAVGLYNERKVVLISPTASTTDLTGIDDYFFRVRIDSGQTGARLGAFAYNKVRVANIAAAVDSSNLRYTDSWYRAFSEAYQKAGGRISDVVKVDVANLHNYVQITEDLLAGNPQGVVLSAGAMDAALICQQLRKRGFKGPLFLSGWSLDPGLLVHGGASVEGAFAAQPFDPQHDGGRWKEFKADFLKRFGYEPGFAAMHAHDAAQLLFAALQKSLDEKIPLKTAIIETGTIDGLQSKVTIDQYGDAMHDIIIETVKNGRLIKVE